MEDGGNEVGCAEGEYEVEPVWGIKGAVFEGGEHGHTGKFVGVPEGKVAMGQYVGCVYEVG